MILLGTKRISFARIRMQKNQEESFELIKSVLDSLNIQKWKEKTINDEKHFIFCRPKLGLIHNNVTNNFYIMAKEEGKNSVIEIYYDLVTFGVYTKHVIDPFYEKLCQLLGQKPPIELEVIESTTYEEIESRANEQIYSDNVSTETHSVAEEIAKLAKLKSEGSISEEEYVKMKNELIEQM